MNTTPVAQQAKLEGASGPSAAEKPLSNFNAFTDQFVKTMEGVSKLAEKGPSNLLLTLGSVLIIAALAMKLKLVGVSISDLHPVEFITIMLVGLVLLAGGSYMRFYQYVSKLKLGKDFGDKMLSMADKALVAVTEPEKNQPPL